LAAGTAPHYPGTCARLDADRIEAKRRAGSPATLRFRVPEGTVAFDDLVRGPQSFAALDIGDFVIRRSDDSPAFFFSNALDDALMAVTHILRGEDHLSNTPRQLLLLTALGLTAPRYSHIALVLGEDGAPLGKRQGSRSVRALRDQGYLPLALDNTLARRGWDTPTKTRATRTSTPSRPGFPWTTSDAPRRVSMRLSSTIGSARPSPAAPRPICGDG